MPQAPLSDAETNPSDPPASLVRAIRRVLRPLVRLLLSHRVSYPMLATLLKAIYVEEARDTFSIPGKTQTISRISLLTGIHRKDVKRLRDEVVEEDAAPGHVSLGAQLVSRWTAVAEFQGPDGKPLALPRLRGDGGKPSFESLVESVSKDIRPRAILDEWLRLGIATIDADDAVHLATHAFVPERGFDEKAYFLGRNLHDHVATTAHNLAGEGPAMLERSVYYAKLRPQSIDELEVLSREVGMDALQRVNRRARELQVEDEEHPDARFRMNLGVYFHRASLDASEESSDD